MSVPYARRAGTVLRDNGLWLTAALGLVVFFGTFLVADAGAVVDALSSVEPVTVLAMLGLVTVSYGVRFLKWAYYLRELDVDVPLRVSVLTFFSGLMMIVTPGKVGETWKAWFMRDLSDVPVNRTVAVVGAERVTDLLALTAIAFLGVFLYEQSPAVLVGVTAAFAVGLGVLNWRTACLGALDRCRRLPVVGSHAGSVRRFYENAYDLFRLRPLAVAMALSVVAWGLEGLALWVVLRDFGVSATPVVGLAVFGFGSVVGALSLLPGGLAAAEASIAGSLAALGYPRSVAVGATLVVRAGTLWYGVALGATLFGLYRLRTSNGRSDDPDS